MSIRSADVWYPTPHYATRSNLARLIASLGASGYDDFLRLSVERPDLYWQKTLEHMRISFDPPARGFVDLSRGAPWARFFPGAGFNFAQACLAPPPGPDGADAPAIIAEDETGARQVVSYRDLATRTRRLAAGLSAIGVTSGTPVGLLLPSAPEAVITMLAVAYLGGIVVPLYSGFGSDAVARRLADSGADFLVTAAGFRRKGRTVPLLEVAAGALASVPDCGLIVSYDADAPPPALPHRRWQDLLASPEPVPGPAATLATDPFMIIYTSGTSGKPKGAVHRHAGFPLRVAQDTAFLFDFGVGDRYFWPSDMGWMVGPYSICAALLLKGALVLYSGAPDWPDIGRLRAVAAAADVTHFGTTPTTIRSMAAAPETALRAPAPSIRILMTGGEVIDADAHRWLFHAFGGGALPIINYTGGTECSGGLLTNVVLRPIAPCRFNSTAPGLDVRIVDGHGAAIEAGDGELAVAGPFNGMTAGFWNDDQRYIETYWSRVPGLWMHGDLARREADGQYLLIGRSDDVMKIAGRRVGPSEIEGSVTDGAIVAEALAFSVPDPRLGEAMVLFVVPGVAANPADPSAVQAFARSAIRRKMGASFEPRTVVVLPELVKTRNGKLVRRLARQAWLAERPGDLSAIENPAVFDAIASRCADMRRAPEAQP